MNQPYTINPYPAIGVQFQAGLNAIVGMLQPKPTIDQLVDAIYNVVQQQYYPGITLDHTIELKAIAYNVVNAYRNGAVLSGNCGYSEAQLHYIQLLIGPWDSSIPADSFPDRLGEIEEQIGLSRLTAAEQLPLFLATVTGYTAFKYWTAQIASTGNAGWPARFSSNAFQNYSNVVLWTSAAMNGALSGYSNVHGAAADPFSIASTSVFVASLTGSLTVACGKVLFNWLPRMQNVQARNDV